MKKTLFLSAILSVALCSSAMGAITTTTVETLTVSGVTLPTGTKNVITTDNGDSIDTLQEAAVTFLKSNGNKDNTRRFKVVTANEDGNAAETISAGTLVIAQASVDETSTAAGQLYLSRWTSSASYKTDLTLTNNLVIGASAAGDAIRISDCGGNKYGKITLAGSITLAADSSIGIDGNAQNAEISGSIKGSNKKLTLNSSGVLTLSGGANVGTLDFSTSTNTLNISSQTVRVNDTLDMGGWQNGNKTSVNISDGGKLSVGTSMWLASGASINIKGTGEFIRDNNSGSLSLKALSGETATLKRDLSSTGGVQGGGYGADSTDCTITNALVTMNGDTLKNKLVNSDLIGENANLKVSLQSGYSINEVTANQNMKFFFAGDEGMTVQALTLNSGSDVSVFKAGTEQGTPQADLTTTTLKVNAADSALNGGLVVSGTNATISFVDGATLTLGGKVTIGDFVTVMLTDAMVTAIADGGRVDLFTGATGLTLGNNIVFSGTSVSPQLAGAYKLNYDNGTVYVTPEPATATLSLLALAGLAARRRRH